MNFISKKLLITLSILTATVLAAHFYVRKKSLANRNQIVKVIHSPEEIKSLENDYRAKMKSYAEEKQKQAEALRREQEAAAAARAKQNSMSAEDKRKLEDLAKSLVISGAPLATAPAANEANGKPKEVALEELPSTYEAMGGESFRSIAQKFYGEDTNWQKIWRMNLKVSNTQSIPAGTVIRLPTRQVMAEKEAPPAPVAETAAVATLPDDAKPAPATVRTEVAPPAPASTAAAPTGGEAPQ